MIYHQKTGVKITKLVKILETNEMKLPRSWQYKIKRNKKQSVLWYPNKWMTKEGKL